MNLCIVYLASPSQFLIHPTNPVRRYEVLKYSLQTVRPMFPNTPIYVFHEDYSEEDMRGLQDLVTEFYTVDFSGFDNVYVRVNASKGYMMMCRFFSGILQQHPVLQKHTHYLRFDDDSYLIQPFLTETRVHSYRNYDYVYRSIFFENKPQQSLYDFTIQFLRSLGMTEIEYMNIRSKLQRESFLIGNQYTGKAPYNNFHVSSIRLWKHPIVEKYIESIENVHGVLGQGWLDANIHAMIVWVLSRKYPDIRSLADTAFGYRHNVHVSTLNSLNVIANEKLSFIPDPRDELTLQCKS